MGPVRASDVVMTERPIGEVIAKMSPSRLDVAQRCLALFRFRYVEPDGRNMPHAWRMAFGSAMDDAANVVYRRKLESHETVSSSEVADLFANAWDYNATLVEDFESSSRGELLDVGVRGAALWRDNIAQHVQPTKPPQLHVARDITDPRTREKWTLHGYLDLLCEINSTQVVSDLKTSAKRYNDSALTTNSQPAAYTLLTDVPTFQYHVLTNTKKPQTQVLSAHVSDDVRNSYIVRAGMLRRQVRHAYMTGDWIPNRQHVLCSRRYCDQWERCTREFGGEVKA